MTMKSFLLISWKSVAIAAAVFLSGTARAATRLPAIFADHMVMQRGPSTPIWGWTAPGGKITVSFRGQVASAVADRDGRWTTVLTNLTVSPKGATLTVKGDQIVKFMDVLVGDVWLASGQSNMAMTLAKTAGGSEATESATDPELRVFLLRPQAVSPLAPLNDCRGQWEHALPSTVGKVSAVGYFFARRLREEVDIPIGLVHSAWGGTLAEQWTSRKALVENKETRPLWEAFQRQFDEFDPATATPPDVAKKLLAEWRIRNAEARRTKQRIPRPPKIIGSPAKKRYTPANQFNTMIHPIVPFGLRGVIWYQGEGNRERARQYRTLLPVMIDDWRRRWSRPKLPFYIVQLANIGNPAAEPTESAWAELQFAQFLVSRKQPYSGLAVINDGADTSLHPREKSKVGDRLARWALARDYNRLDIAYSGPLYRESRIEDGSIRVFFDHADGLCSRDGKPLERFQIAGADRVWHWADARIDAESVVVSSPSVGKPVAVRYAWMGNPTGANLTNASGLPASLFGTDNGSKRSPGKPAPKE